jgi:hypothetical protein
MADFGYHTRKGFTDKVVRDATEALLRSLDRPADTVRATGAGQ